LAISSRDSQAVLKLPTYSPFSVPNTNAFGPSFPRRLRTAATRPIRIERDAPVLLVLGCVARDPDCVTVPIDSLVLDEEHLAESATQLERADDSIVHQWPDILVLPRVHGQGRIEEPLFLLA
jgi:hypothetical protein